MGELTKIELSKIKNIRQLELAEIQLKYQVEMTERSLRQNSSAFVGGAKQLARSYVKSYTKKVLTLALYRLFKNRFKGK